MKRVLCLTIIILIANMMKGQDFATRFMKEYPADTILNCITVGPKMMDKMRENEVQQRSAHMEELINSLKSIRIIETQQDIDQYHQRATELLKQNSNRFTALNEVIYVRRKKNVIVELVALAVDKNNHSFQIINITGSMDDNFIKNLAQMMNVEMSVE